MTESQGAELSLNAVAAPLVAQLVAEAALLRLGIDYLDNGCRLIDAGLQLPGSLEAGRRLAEIALGGLGQVSLHPDMNLPGLGLRLEVRSSQPLLAALASQYPGWSLQQGKGRGAYAAWGSGPARALRGDDGLLNQLNYRDRHSKTCLLLDAEKAPPLDLVDSIAEQCGIEADELTLVLVPPHSPAGLVLGCARLLGFGLRKALALGCTAAQILEAAGSVPLPTPAASQVVTAGRCLEAIRWGGQLSLLLRQDAALAQRLAAKWSLQEVPVLSPQWPPVLPGPAQLGPALLRVTVLDSGAQAQGGSLDLNRLSQGLSSP